MMRTARGHPGFWAFVVHRISGVALALFLPLHLYVLGLALEGEARLDAFLRWAEQPTVKALETALVVLLAAHLLGGLRLLAVELAPWFQRQRLLLAVAGIASLAVGAAFVAAVI